MELKKPCWWEAAAVVCLRGETFMKAKLRAALVAAVCARVV
jgi:hypothetical protein